MIVASIRVPFTVRYVFSLCLKEEEVLKVARRKSRHLAAISEHAEEGEEMRLSADGLQAQAVKKFMDGAEEDLDSPKRRPDGKMESQGAPRNTPITGM